MIDLEKLREMIREVVREEFAKLRPATDEYLSTADAAAVAKVNQGTVRRWIRQGRLKPHSAGRELRVRRADLESLMRGVRPDEDEDRITDEIVRRRLG